MDFRGLSDGFLGGFRGFLMKFQMDFGAVLGGSQDYNQEVFSTSESDTPQNVFRA